MGHKTYIIDFLKIFFRLQHAMLSNKDIIKWRKGG
jgi:hypothetical protein